MYDIYIDMLSLSDADVRFRDQVPVSNIASDVDELGPMAMTATIQPPAFHGIAGTPVSALFFWLPPVPLAELQRLAAGELFAYNENSADLRRCTMYLALTSDKTLLRCPGWSLSFPHLAHVNVFQVVLVSAGHVLVASHHLDACEMDGLIGGFQACAMASGPNYRPWRLWPEKEMEEAEGREDSPEPGVITARVTSLKENWQQIVRS